MGWEVNTVPGLFSAPQSGDAANGNPASSSFFAAVGQAQTFVSSVATDKTSFINAPISGGNVASLTNPVDLKFQVEVPPFVTFMGFALLISGPTSRTDTNVLLTCTETSRSTDTGPVGISGSDNVTNAIWRYMRHESLGGSDQQGIGQALRVMETASNAWTQRTVEVSIGSGGKLYAGYYWFLKPSEITVP